MKNDRNWDYFTNLANQFYDSENKLEEIVNSNSEVVSDFDALYKVIMDAYLYKDQNAFTSKIGMLEDVFYLLYKSEIDLDKYETHLPIIKQINEEKTLTYNECLSQTFFCACLFTSLSLFLHNTKRIKPLTTKAFLLRNTNDKDLKKYIEYVYQHKKDDYVEKGKKVRIIKPAEDRLRQTRKHIFSQRGIKNNNKAWSAMRADQEFEWALDIILDDKNFDEEIRKTYSHLTNLNNSISELFNTDSKSITPETIKAALDKYYKKLNKIEYSKYLKTWNFILNRLNEDQKHFGLNLYRLEKESKIFENTETIKKLLACETDEEEEEILSRYFLLRDCYFPKLKELFNTIHLDYMKGYFSVYKRIFDGIAFKSRFLLEEMVRLKVFGDDWEDFFYEVLNDMIPTLFYLPSEVDFDIRPGAEEKFIELLMYDTERYLETKFPIIIK